MAVQRAVAEHWKASDRQRLTQAWGLTETSPGVRQPVRTTSSTARSACRSPSTEITIRDDDGNELPIGESGEICVRGPQVMLGYWNRPDETAKVMIGDWLRTGDIGRMDDARLRVHRGPQEGHDPRVRASTCIRTRSRAWSPRIPAYSKSRRSRSPTSAPARRSRCSSCARTRRSPRADLIDYCRAT